MKRVIKAATSTSNIYYWNGVDEVPEDVVHVVIEDGVTEISEGSFEDREELQSVSIPGSVTSVESFAFYGCTYLKKVVIGEGVKTIGQSAFNSCYSLERVTIPDSVTSVGIMAFAHCKSLGYIKLSNNLQVISSGMFEFCVGLYRIEIPEGVQVIGERAFADCKKLVQVKLPKSLKEIRSSAFSDCNHLKFINVPRGVSLGDFVFFRCPNLDIADQYTTYPLEDYNLDSVPEPSSTPTPYLVSISGDEKSSRIVDIVDLASVVFIEALGYSEKDANRYKGPNCIEGIYEPIYNDLIDNFGLDEENLTRKLISYLVETDFQRFFHDYIYDYTIRPLEPGEDYETDSEGYLINPEDADNGEYDDYEEY